MLGQPSGPKEVLSFNDIRRHGVALRKQADSARELRREERNDYQRAVLKLDYAVTLYWRPRHSLNAGDPEALALLLEHHQRELPPVARRIRENASSGVTDEEIAVFRGRSCVTLQRPILLIFGPSPTRSRRSHEASGSRWVKA